jgi:hypothetical protein
MLGNESLWELAVRCDALDGSHARLLHKSLRSTFRELVRHANATDDAD